MKISNVTFFLKLKNIWNQARTSIFFLPLATVYLCEIELPSSHKIFFFFVCRVFTTCSRVRFRRDDVLILLLLLLWTYYVFVVSRKRRRGRRGEALYVIMHIIIIRAYSWRARLWFLIDRTWLPRRFGHRSCVPPSSSTAVAADASGHNGRWVVFVFFCPIF